MASRRLIEFLDRENAKYSIVRHSPAVTASEIAEAAHLSGRLLAKTVIVNVNGRLAMAVVPASDRLHPERLAEDLGSNDVKIAPESAFRDRFPDCEPGAMPPFGNLYDMTVFLSPLLAREEMIAFNAGTHHELVQMRYDDFERLVQPVLLPL